MRKLLTILFAISFLSVSAQYKSNYTLTCVDTVYYTKATKFNPSSYECKRGIELKKPDRTKKFFKYPVQIQLHGGQVHLYDFEGNSEIFPIIRTIPNSIQEVIQLVKECNAGVDIVDDADSVIGNENTTNVSVTNVDETYTVTITNADGSTVTNTFDIDLFEGVDTTGLDQLICDITLSKIVTNESITTVYNPVTEVYDVVVTDSNGDFVQTTLDIDLFENVDTTDLKQLILDCVPEYETIDYTVTETTTTETINGEEVDICCIYQLEISLDPIKCDTLRSSISIETVMVNEYQEHNYITNEITGEIDTIIECIGEFTKSTSVYNLPRFSPEADSDSTFTVTTCVDACGNIAIDTTVTWVDSYCVDDETCTVGYTAFNSGQQMPICEAVSEGQTLTYNANATIYEDGNTDCANFLDDNGDSYTITGGTISNLTGATVSGNVVTINAPIWSFDVTGAPFSLEVNVGGANSDFFVMLDEMQIEVDTVCQPLCNPPITSTETTNPDAATGIATASFSITKLGSPVTCNECVSLIFEQSNGDLIQQFDGLTCGALSSFTNYNAAWFPDGTETVGHNTTIEINKQQMAIDLGLDGTNADSWTVYVVAGGQCAGSESKCPNPSSQNEEAYMCEITHFAFDNQNIDLNIISTVGNIRKWSIFQSESPYPSIGGIIEATLLGCMNESDLCDGTDIPNNNLGVDWYITQIGLGSQILNYNQLIPEDLSTPANQIHAFELRDALIALDLFNNLSFENRNDILTQSVGRCFNFIQASYCSDKDLKFIRAENEDGSCYAIYQVEPFSQENF